MKLLTKIMIPVMMLIATSVFATSAFAATANSCRYDSTISGGDDNPWPWGREILFPWLSIQGVWAPTDGTCNSLFVFRTKNSQTENRVVHIMQYDPNTCEKLAWGAGVETDRVVRAAMVTKEGKSFDLTVRAFDENSVTSVATHSPFNRNVVVLSMYPKGNWERRMSYQMAKVTDVPVMLCDSKIPVFGGRSESSR
ncbi:MAG: hypothetical protein KF767_00030 [Bdellovibrionaceae bacterium]|nr:hypothetical protein [Pseudobdellovibrionaceae bacterium]